MSNVFIERVDNVFIRVHAEPHVIMELSDYLTFKAPGYKFSPKYKAKQWNGDIHLLNRLTCMVYGGLIKRIKKLCDERGYPISWDESLFYDDISREEVIEFIDALGIPVEIEARDYQIDSIRTCVSSRRRTLISPTSSGKSFMIYAITQWFKKEKALIIVPTVNLVNQMESDFREYGYKGEIHTSVGGLSKSNDIDADIVITTWQSVDNGKTKQTDQWYKQFGLVFGDEAHGCKAASLIRILKGLSNAKYRFGTTGTLDDEPLNVATIEGLFGPQYRSISTKEMIDQGYATKIIIKCLVLRYPEEERKAFAKAKNSYADELQYITNHTKRNNFVRNLTTSLKGNKLVFFRLKDHGKRLFDLISERSNGNVFYIDGGVKGELREQIRKAIEDEENATLVGSLGTTSTGVNIKKLHHMIAGSPSKSKTKVLQSIGRLLRQHSSKDVVYMYDVVDDLTWKKNINFVMNHFLERTKIYDKEQFEYQIFQIDL